MRTDCEIDNRQMICPNASLLGTGQRVVKAGSFFSFNNGNGNQVARSLGRISGNDSPTTKYILAMVLANDATFAYERWVNPIHVTRIVDSPAQLAAFFFAPKLPYDVATMRRLMEYGTVAERYVSRAEQRVTGWKVESSQ